LKISEGRDLWNSISTPALWNLQLLLLSSLILGGLSQPTRKGDHAQGVGRSPQGEFSLKVSGPYKRPGLPRLGGGMAETSLLSKIPQGGFEFPEREGEVPPPETKCKCFPPGEVKHCPRKNFHKTEIQKLKKLAYSNHRYFL